jgi:hypothetical protein
MKNNTFEEELNTLLEKYRGTILSAFDRGYLEAEVNKRLYSFTVIIEEPIDDIQETNTPTR